MHPLADSIGRLTTLLQTSDVWRHAFADRGNRRGAQNTITRQILTLAADFR
jgi:hypothetical protein